MDSSASHHITSHAAFVTSHRSTSTVRQSAPGSARSLSDVVHTHAVRRKRRSAVLKRALAYRPRITVRATYYTAARWRPMTRATHVIDPYMLCIYRVDALIGPRGAGAQGVIIATRRTGASGQLKNLRLRCDARLFWHGRVDRSLLPADFNRILCR